jgi:hypothetical protein
MTLRDANARAEASRRNGAKSRGPITAAGKARSSRNALKHGLRAQRHVLLDDESGRQFEALAQALVRDLAPVGALQTVLTKRMVAAAWRLERADRIEAELFERNGHDDHGPLASALVRDGHGARSFDTLLRYRGAAIAELWRSLQALKALQAEAAIPCAIVAEPNGPEKPADFMQLDSGQRRLSS